MYALSIRRGLRILIRRPDLFHSHPQPHADGPNVFNTGRLPAVYLPVTVVAVRHTQPLGKLPLCDMPSFLCRPFQAKLPKDVLRFHNGIISRKNGKVLLHGHFIVDITRCVPHPRKDLRPQEGLRSILKQAGINPSELQGV